MSAIKQTLGVMLALWAIAGSAESVRADGPTFSTVAGIARFERHNTLTPQLCNEDGCIKPQPYWSLVLAAGGTRYELNRPFDVGREDAPESIELNSVVIRPGTRVQLQAHVDVINRSYSILSNVRSVRVAMDMRDGPFELLERDLDLDLREIEGSPFFGWTCRSTSESRPVYVDVVQVARGSSYAMRIVTESGSDEPGFHTLAAFDRVALTMNSQKIGFTGDSRGLHAELDIDQSNGRIGPLDSTLRLSGEPVHTGISLPVEVPVSRSVQLICDRTR
jgi:hypothetical protein